jgi:hypothetical protein
MISPFSNEGTRRRPMKPSTMRPDKPSGKTVGLALVIFTSVLLLAEVVLRQPAVQAGLPSPSLGIGHHSLDLRLAFLRKLVQEEGPVECIFLGTSQVVMAVNPVLFSTSYKEHNGKEIRGFNLGVEGLTLPSAEALIRIVINLYRPRLIIFGLLPAQFGEQYFRPSEERILSNPWIRYQLGEFNWAGWETEHFTFYRYFLSFRQWLEQPDFYSSLRKKESVMSPYGFGNFRNVQSSQGLLPDAERAERFEKRLKDFTISPDRLDDFEKILSHSREIELVVVDMPTHPTFWTYYGRGEADHWETIEEIKKRCKQWGVLFISGDSPLFRPDRLWRQTNHMNALGAELYSRWLGGQVGSAVRDGLIRDHLGPEE